MTIRFSNIDTFVKSLDFLTFNKRGSEELTANCCVLIQQTNYTTTVLTTHEPTRVVYRYYFVHTEEHSGGVEGASYLVEFEGFKKQLMNMKAASSNSITLQMVRGTLKLIADLTINEGVRRQKGNLSSKLYAGPITDFAPQEESTICYVEANRTEFISFITMLSDFGEFTGESIEGNAVGRTVMFSLDPLTQTIEGLTNNKTACGYLKLKCKGDIDTSLVKEGFRFSVEGRYLKSLTKIALGESVKILFNEDKSWVTFTGDRGSLTLSIREDNSSMIRDYSLFSDTTRIQTQSVRSCQLQELVSAVTMQNTTDGLRADIALVELPPHIIVFPGHDVTGTNKSYVSLDPSTASGTWQPLLMSNSGISSLLKALTSFFKRSGLFNNSIVLTQKFIQRASGTKSWLLYVSFEQAEVQHLLDSLIVCNDLTINLDLVDTND
jgi:hypothetical protein